MFDMYGGYGLWEQKQKAHKGRIDTPIYIVYDGKAPRKAATNLYYYIRKLGYETRLVDADDYQKGHDGSVIVVGHHELSKEWLEYIGVRYDSYGMGYGFSGNLCVLMASRSALGSGRKGRKLFEEHYNKKIIEHLDRAIEYKVPGMFGYRNETRKSQYDLLWLEFVKYGLSMFLDENNLTLENQFDFVEDAVDDLVQQMEETKEITLTMDELLRNSYKQYERNGIKTLHTHLGKNIIFTGLWGNPKEERELEDNELLEGELSAFTFKIGCYVIRSARRLYQDLDGIHYAERVPATKEMVAEYQKNHTGIKALICENEYLREVHEISAKHVKNQDEISVDEWKHVCFATDSLSWGESIEFIATVKNDSSIGDEQAELFVLKTYAGSSYGIDYWYKLTPDGKVTEYREHPFDSDSFKVSWKE